MYCNTYKWNIRKDIEVVKGEFVILVTFLYARLIVYGKKIL